MTVSTKASGRDWRARRHEGRTGIARLLHAHYSSMLEEPVPSEIKSLITQLLAIEARKRASTARAVEVLQLAMSAPARQP